MTVNPRGETPDVGVPRRLAAMMTVGEQQDWLRAHLRRHVVSRRTALRGGAGALAALWATPWALAGCASPPIGVVGRHLSFGADPTTRMAIAGELTARPSGRVLVDVGTDATYGRAVEAEVRELVSMVPQEDGSISAADQFFVHAPADGLAPGATFHYRFRLADGSTTPDATFTTAPAGPTPFTFTAFGDQGVSTGPRSFANTYKSDDTRRSAAPADALVELVAAQRPAFHLLAGDICYADPGGTGSAVRNGGGKKFDRFDPMAWTRYFASIERSAATTPWLFTTGNHDMEALYDANMPGGATHGYAGHAARLDLPPAGPSGCPSVYSVVYGNVGILSLDANDLSQEIPTNAGYSGGAQLRWLEQRLSALRADPAIDFVVTFFHHCAYATGAGHASDGGVRAALAPLFDRFSVDLVVQGHNHQYERTNPIRGGRSTTQAPDGATVDPATAGTTYICCGSGGRARYRWQPGEPDRIRGAAGPDTSTMVTSFVAGPDGAEDPETVDWSQSRYLGYAFLAVHVAPGPRPTMSVRAVTDLGEEIDRVNLVRSTRPPRPAAPAAWHVRSGSGLSVPGHVA